MTGSADLDAVLSGPVLEAAPRILGATLRHGRVAVRITEVEAYAGEEDPGSHAYRGLTARNATMFGPPGHLYCYFVYGMHYCANVVCGPVGAARAVLLRAGQVVDGIDLARSRRTGPDRDLARGPARLCRALDVGRELDGASLTSGPVSLSLAAAPPPAGAVRTGPRVGLRAAAERPWRFWLAGEETVSDYRPASAAQPAPSTARNRAVTCRSVPPEEGATPPLRPPRERSRGHAVIPICTAPTTCLLFFLVAPPSGVTPRAIELTRIEQTGKFSSVAPSTVSIRDTGSRASDF